MNIRLFYIRHMKEEIFASMQVGLVGLEILFAKTVWLS